ncbi:hypothetical protein FRB93_005478 [Tulasnella sp. JGI-2019a]|nr:hypothetical protein FRB93_005478 [Tulasnella sp. JGI-2019a]
MNLNAVHLVAILSSLTAWGFYTCIFIATIRALRSRAASLASFPALIIISIFIWNLVDLVCIVFTVYKGFIIYEDGPTVYWTLYESRKIDDALYAISDFSTACAAFSCDILMLWRTYVVWSRNKRIIYLPASFLFCSTLGSIVICVYDIFGAQWSTADAAYLDQLFYLIATVFGLNIVTTWYLTSFLVYRLWSVEKETQSLEDYEARVSGNSYRTIMRVVIQSGAIHSMTEVAILASVITKARNYRYLLGYLNIRVIGFATAFLIWLSLRENRVSDSEAPAQTPTSNSLPVFRMPIEDQDEGDKDHGVDLRLSPVVTQDVNDIEVREVVSSLARENAYQNCK